MDFRKIVGGVAAVGDDDIRVNCLVDRVNGREVCVVEIAADLVVSEFRIHVDVMPTMIAGAARGLFIAQVMQSPHRLMGKPHHWMQVHEVGRPEMNVIDIVAADLLPPKLRQQHGVGDERMVAFERAGQLL